jgi:hypothetical protein
MSASRSKAPRTSARPSRSTPTPVVASGDVLACVKYDDGDCEDMYLQELAQMVLTPEQCTAAGRGGGTSTPCGGGTSTPGGAGTATPNTERAQAGRAGRASWCSSASPVVSTPSTSCPSSPCATMGFSPDPDPDASKLQKAARVAAHRRRVCRARHQDQGLLVSGQAEDARGRP